RVADLAQAVARAADELQRAEDQGHEQRQQVLTLQEDLRKAMQRLAELRDQVQADKNEHLEQMRQAAGLHNDVVGYKAHLDTLSRERDRLRLKTEQAAENLASLDVELQELTEADQALQGRLAASRQVLADQRQQREDLRQQCDQTAEMLANLRAQSSGLASRVEVLERLERSHEGLGTGVREMLEIVERSRSSGAAAAPDAEAWDFVLGLVADFL